MKRKNMSKRIVTFFICFALLITIIPTEVQAAPAPSLTQIGFTDLTFDDQTGQVYVEVTEIGTSRSRTVWANNSVCQENIYATANLWGSNNIRYGMKRYYKLNGVYAHVDSNGFVTTNKPGVRYTFRASYSNAMSPFNTLTTSATITLP